MIRTTSCMRCTINYICSPISRIKYTNPAAIQSVYLYGQRHRGGGCHKPLLPGQIGLEEGKVSTSRGGRCCVEHLVEATTWPWIPSYSRPCLVVDFGHLTRKFFPLILWYFIEESHKRPFKILPNFRLLLGSSV
jgi:hypothetical protein